MSCVQMSLEGIVTGWSSPLGGAASPGMGAQLWVISWPKGKERESKKLDLGKMFVAKM